MKQRAWFQFIGEESPRIPGVKDSRVSFLKTLSVLLNIRKLGDKMRERSYTDKKPNDKEKKCRQPQHLKFIPIISDPGVISLPGVLNS